MERTGGQDQGPFGPGGDPPDDETRERARPESPETQPATQPPPPPLWSAPQNAEPPQGPQSPAGPQSPQSPQSPAGPQSPPAVVPQSAPPPPPGSQAPPQSPLAAPQAPPAPPGYGGPVPPGGWHQPQPVAYSGLGELAGWGSRVGAYLLDWLIVIVVLFVGALVIAGAAAASEVAGIVVGIVLGLVMLAVFLGYWSFLTARKGEHNGQTLGKQVVGIRVVRDDGRPMDAGSSLLRELVLQGVAVHVASSIIPLIPWFLNYFWPLWDDSDRALHDMVVKTHVTKT